MFALATGTTTPNYEIDQGGNWFQVYIVATKNNFQNVSQWVAEEDSGR